MKRKITRLSLALLSLLMLMPAALPAAAADYIAAAHTAGNGRPYYIMVNRAQNTVTVYGLDDDGYYTVPVKAMVCSVGRQGHATPRGTFSIGGRWPWLHMFDNSYGQYATQISGNILFHSVCYTKRDPSTLMADEYNMLGSPASLGCVRLQTVDAKWIYDNCASGTRVTVYDGTEPGPLGKPDKLVAEITPEMDNGWDPTDPREENPWVLLPFTDVNPGAWYYNDVRYVYETGLLPGATPDTFSPNAPMTHAMMAQALYRLSGAQGADYQAALDWGMENGIWDGIPFDPDARVTRQELALVLYRYETAWLGRPARNTVPLEKFTDGAASDDQFREALRWAVGNGLLQGTAANALRPAGYASRVQAAAVLHRYGTLS